MDKFNNIDYVHPTYRLFVMGTTGPQTSQSQNGIFVDAYTKIGVFSETTSGTAIWGKATNNGYAAKFEGLTQFDGDAEFITNTSSGTAIWGKATNFGYAAKFDGFTQFNGVAEFTINVGIGIANPQKLLHVEGGDILVQNGRLLLSDGANQIELTADGLIHAREIEVDLDVIPPDYVFEDDYDLMPLIELQKFIDLNHHLPNIRSAAEYEAYGRIPLKELSFKLLEKVEELTLYTLEQEQKIEDSKAENKAIHDALIEINKEIKALKAENTRLKQEIESLK
jgi:hypothetical protein